jgi:hypothetical protein
VKWTADTYGTHPKQKSNAWHLTESGPSADNVKLKEVKQGIDLLIILNENYNDLFLKDVNS